MLNFVWPTWILCFSWQCNGSLRSFSNKYWVHPCSVRFFELTATVCRYRSVCVCVWCVTVRDRCWVRARKRASVTRRRHVGRTSCFCQFSATRLTKTSTSSSRRLTRLIRDMCETWSLDEPVTYTTIATAAAAAAATTTTTTTTNTIFGFCLTGLFFLEFAPV